MPQLFKLRKKAAAGARFVVKQIGWNARKDDELLRWIRREELPLKALANVYLLSRSAARHFHRGGIPGVVVSDALLELAERYGAGEDKGRAFFVELAAKHVAVARGLGYDGVYLGGHMPAATFARDPRHRGDVRRRRLARARTRDPLRRRRRVLPLRAGRGHRARDGRREPCLPRVEAAAPHRPAASRSATVSAGRSTVRSSTRTRPLFPVARAAYGAAERSRPVTRSLHLVEQAVKVPMFHCQDCGDCSLPDIAYVCPESMCAKNQRNGPCGGTRDGLCEVYDSECIWSQAYERLKAYGEEESMLDGPTVVKDNALRATSAWANAFLGRDHNAGRNHQ